MYNAITGKEMRAVFLGLFLPISYVLIVCYNYIELAVRYNQSRWRFTLYGLLSVVIGFSLVSILSWFVMEFVGQFMADKRNSLLILLNSMGFLSIMAFVILLSSVFGYRMLHKRLRRKDTRTHGQDILDDTIDDI